MCTITRGIVRYLFTCAFTICYFVDVGLLQSCSVVLKVLFVRYACGRFVWCTVLYQFIYTFIWRFFIGEIPNCYSIQVRKTRGLNNKGGIYEEVKKLAPFERV